ncbi:MAG: hypothetical protein ABR586_05650 [Thermoplasmatota archaeon]
MRKLDKHEAKVCFKLYRQGCFGKGHKLVDTVTSGFPSHELDLVASAINRLIKDGILVAHPTKHGQAVAINVHLRLELYAVLRTMLDYAWLPK